MNKKIIKDTFILFVITLVSGLLLGFTYVITKGPIDAAEQNKKNEACAAVMKEASDFAASDADLNELNSYINESYNADIQEISEARASDGSVIGYVFTINTHEGYGGDIVFSMGVDMEGTITGIEFVTISETVNIGMNADKSEFKSQFAGKKAENISYTKSETAGENEINAISGATITTNAVTIGVNAGVMAFGYVTGGSAE